MRPYDIASRLLIRLLAGVKNSSRSGVVAVDTFRLTRRTFASLKLWRAPSVPRLAIDVRAVPAITGEPVVCAG